MCKNDSEGLKSPIQGVLDRIAAWCRSSTRSEELGQAPRLRLLMDLPASSKRTLSTILIGLAGGTVASSVTETPLYRCVLDSGIPRDTPLYRCVQNRGHRYSVAPSQERRVGTTQGKREVPLETFCHQTSDMNVELARTSWEERALGRQLGTRAPKHIDRKVQENLR